MNRLEELYERYSKVGSFNVSHTVCKCCNLNSISLFLNMSSRGSKQPIVLQKTQGSDNKLVLVYIYDYGN